MATVLNNRTFSAEILDVILNMPFEFSEPALSVLATSTKYLKNEWHLETIFSGPYSMSQGSVIILHFSVLALATSKKCLNNEWHLETVLLCVTRTVIFFSINNSINQWHQETVLISSYVCVTGILSKNYLKMNGI